ncbi:MAG TPA: DUF4389 domain-containing protein [Streptosporangiaceae bacterium]|nr:DUF4389 domain-containing protein [Streptosporangiaceae bacterium]
MPSTAAYPVRVDASLDPRLSRWLWLVKWLLVIPHYVVLCLLWIAFAVLSVAAFFAILFTGRYPRAIFDFNVGVLRWSWRVAYYAYGALGTDRYPPFTLAEVPDYPAHLEIGYPGRLSRWLVLVKWWLLALPHYLIVALFAGGGTWLAWQSGHARFNLVGGGLIGLLVLVAAVVLAATGRYPRPLFDFVLGMNRWVLRVAAYAGLMTDTYPPFRLDQGGPEPGGTLTVPGPTTPSTTPPAAPGGPPVPPAPPEVSRWTPGRVVSVVAGSVVALVSVGLLGGGGVALWADQAQRQDGYLTSSPHTYSTGGYAVASKDIHMDTGPAWRTDSVLGDIRLRVTSGDPGRPVFVGVAPADAAAAYLAGVAHTRASGFPADKATYVARQGGAPATPPARRAIWAAQAGGAGTQTLVWPLRRGDWTVVVMNADGSAGVTVRVDAGATFPALAEIGWGLLAGGVVFLAGGVALIAWPIYRASRSG